MSVISNNQLAGAAGQGGAAGFKIDRSLRFNSADSAYLNKTFSAGDRRKWTWSGWVKRSNLTTQQALWSAGSTGDVHRKSAIECGNASIATVAWSASIFLAPRAFTSTVAWQHRGCTQQP